MGQHMLQHDPEHHIPGCALTFLDGYVLSWSSITLFQIESDTWVGSWLTNVHVTWQNAYPLQHFALLNFNTRDEADHCVSVLATG